MLILLQLMMAFFEEKGRFLHLLEIDRYFHLCRKREIIHLNQSLTFSYSDIKFIISSKNFLNFIRALSKRLPELRFDLFVIRYGSE